MHTPACSTSKLASNRHLGIAGVVLLFAASLGGDSPGLRAASFDPTNQLTVVRPNVVLIVADDLGYGTLSSYGGQELSTPHIDSLASDGIRFTQGYVTAATCSPSRAGLTTGRYQQRFGFEFNAGGLERTILEPIGLDPSEQTLADTLGEVGYATGIVGKWHLGVQPQFLPNVRGFHEFFGFLPGEMCYLPCPERGVPVENSIFRDSTPVVESEYLTDAFAREASDYIDRHAAESFFLYVPFNAIHTPLEATQEYLDRFPGVADPDTRAYLAMTSALDDAVGVILDALQRNGLEQNTLVIFTSDNGATLNFAQSIQANGPLALGKGLLFEGGIRVPLLMRWTGTIDPGLQYDRPVSTMDIKPTLLAVLGAPQDPTLDGVNLVPYLRGTATGNPHDFLFWRNGPQTGAVRSGKWKMIRSVQGSVWLYDLDNDIGETQNLASQRPGVVQFLTSNLLGWSATLSDPAWSSRSTNVVTIDGQPYQVSI